MDFEEDISEILNEVHVPYRTRCLRRCCSTVLWTKRKRPQSNPLFENLSDEEYFPGDTV
jgi:hypothetical protein